MSSGGGPNPNPNPNPTPNPNDRRSQIDEKSKGEVVGQDTKTIRMTLTLDMILKRKVQLQNVGSQIRRNIKVKDILTHAMAWWIQLLYFAPWVIDTVQPTLQRIESNLVWPFDPSIGDIEKYCVELIERGRQQLSPAATEGHVVDLTEITNRMTTEVKTLLDVVTMNTASLLQFMNTAEGYANQARFLNLMEQASHAAIKRSELQRPLFFHPVSTPSVEEAQKKFIRTLQGENAEKKEELEDCNRQIVALKMTVADKNATIRLQARFIEKLTTDFDDAPED